MENINNAPAKPSLLYPTDKLVCTSTNLKFEWEAVSDSENDVVNYEVMISRNEQFTDIFQTAKTESTSRNFNLEKGQGYFWRVNAVDSEKNESGYQNIWLIGSAVMVFKGSISW